MSNNTNFTTTVTKPQAVMPVWLVDYSTGELVNEVRTGERSSDGRFLVKHGKLNQKVAMHSSEDVAMAAAFNCDADELFAGRSRR